MAAFQVQHGRPSATRSKNRTFFNTGKRVAHAFLDGTFASRKPASWNKCTARQVRIVSYSQQRARRACLAPHSIAPFLLGGVSARRVGRETRWPKAVHILVLRSLSLHHPTHTPLPPPSSHYILPISPPLRHAAFLGIVCPSFRPFLYYYYSHHHHAPYPSPPSSPLTPSSLQSSRRIFLRSCDPSKGRTTSRIPRRTDHRPPSTHRAHACTHRISSHSSAPLREVKQQ